MTANELVELIPKKVFEELCAETKVDHQVKKLTGEVMFKLILFSMLSPNKISLRVIEAMLQSSQCRAFCHHKEQPESRFNSIRDRIYTIKADYFEKLYQDIFSIYNKEIHEEKALSKADSLTLPYLSNCFICLCIPALILPSARSSIAST